MVRARGFTLIELLLSIAIITLLVGMSLPLYASFVGRNDLDMTTQRVVSALRRAQEYTRGVRGDSQWGVAVQSGQAVLFKGATYATRDSSFDETTTIASSITPSGTGEIAFTKLSGTPSSTATFTLASSATNDTRTITVNAKGMVNY
jgi:prepilin-type N-terminal cleavage/methylation domain-containing protein